MKECKECKIKKVKTKFYPAQGECKECTKKRVRLREKKLKSNPLWVEKEKTRNREKYHRLKYKDKHKPDPKNKKETGKKYKEKHPEKVKAKNYTSNLVKVNKNNHFHHWSYNKQHYKDVFELKPKAHYKLHRHLKYDKNTFMYKTLDGVLLDTRKKHLNYILLVL